MGPLHNIWIFLNSPFVLGFIGLVFITTPAALYKIRSKKIEHALEHYNSVTDDARVLYDEVQESISDRHSLLTIVLEVLPNESDMENTDCWKRYMRAVRRWNKGLLTLKANLIRIEQELGLQGSNQECSIPSLLYDSSQDSRRYKLAAGSDLKARDKTIEPACVHFGFWLAHRYVRYAMKCMVVENKMRYRDNALSAHDLAQKRWTDVSQRLADAIKVGQGHVDQLEGLSIPSIILRGSVYRAAMLEGQNVQIDQLGK